MKRTGMKHYIIGFFMTMLFMSVMLLGGCGQKKSNDVMETEQNNEEKPESSDSEKLKQSGDLITLQEILGKTVSESDDIYEWDEKGNLIAIRSGRDLTGSICLSEFRSLKEFESMFSDNLTELDVSGCTALEKLVYWGNEYTSNLVSLNVSNCTALRELDCRRNKLTDLNVSGCVALEKLCCAVNRLSDLDVSDCTALSYLNCCVNYLSSLDVSECSELTYLNCDENHLSGTLELIKCGALESLSCERNYNLRNVKLLVALEPEKIHCDNGVMIYSYQ